MHVLSSYFGIFYDGQIKQVLDNQKYEMAWIDRDGNSDTGYPETYTVSLKEVALDLVPSVQQLDVGTKVLYPYGSKYTGCGGYSCDMWQNGVITKVCQGDRGQLV